MRSEGPDPLERCRRRRSWASSPSAAPRARPEGAKRRPRAVSDMAVAAEKTYIAPGDLDEYYLFSSGGHSGQVYVYGVPSMRHITTIPVFTPIPRTGYGFDDDSKAMLGGPHLGRRPSPGALRDQGRLRRPLALHQRHERPHRAHRPARLQDQADPRARSPTSRATTLVLRHAQHRVRDDGLALLDPDPQGHRTRRSRSTQPTTRASWRASRSIPRPARCPSAGRS